MQVKRIFGCLMLTTESAKERKKCVSVESFKAEYTTIIKNGITKF